MNIITKKQLQQKIGQIKDLPYTVVNRGKPEVIIIPYFEGGEELIEDYMEDFEMHKNRKKLKKELQKSLDSGLSDHRI